MKKRPLGAAEMGYPRGLVAARVHQPCSLQAQKARTINPHEIAQKSGSGADCMFDAQASPAAKSNP
jgi:hypothetical protein